MREFYGSSKGPSIGCDPWARAGPVVPRGVPESPAGMATSGSPSRRWGIPRQLGIGRSSSVVLGGTTFRASTVSVKASREGLMLLPRPDTINLYIERPAEKNPDHNDSGEHCHTDRILVNYDRSDDVGNNEDFEAQQDHSSEMLPQVVIGASAASGDQVEHAGVNQSAQSTQNQDGHTNALYDLDDVLYVVVEIHGAAARNSKTDPREISSPLDMVRSSLHVTEAVEPGKRLNPGGRGQPLRNTGMSAGPMHGSKRCQGPARSTFEARSTNQREGGRDAAEDTAQLFCGRWVHAAGSDPRRWGRDFEGNRYHAMPTSSDRPLESVQVNGLGVQGIVSKGHESLSEGLAGSPWATRFALHVADPTASNRPTGRLWNPQNWLCSLRTLGRLMPVRQCAKRGAILWTGPELMYTSIRTAAGSVGSVAGQSSAMHIERVAGSDHLGAQSPSKID